MALAAQRKFDAMTDVRAVLQRTADLAADYLDSLEERPVFPQISVDVSF